MKTYPTQNVAAGAWNVDTKTFMKYVEETVRLMTIYLPEYPWEDRYVGIPKGKINLVVDVTRVQIEKPQGRAERDFYSAKDKFHAIKFEVVSTLKTPKIVWVSPGYVGKDSDLTIARAGLLKELDADEKVIADLG